MIPYILVDGIYPRLRIFNGQILDPRDEQLQYKVAQESMRKDIERTIGVVTVLFQFLKSGLCFWKHEDIVEITDCYVILHNMPIPMFKAGMVCDDNAMYNAAVEMAIDDMMHRQWKQV